MLKKSPGVFLKTAFFILIIVGAFYLADLARENDTIRELVSGYGYVGVFGIAILSGFNLAVPVPTVAFMPLFIESGLNFWISVLVITFGVTLADSFTYVIGRFGREIISAVPDGKIFSILERASEKYWLLPMILIFFFAALVPLPNEILVVPLGFLNYKFSRIWPAILAGNFVFNMIYSAGVIGLFKFI